MSGTVEHEGPVRIYLHPTHYTVTCPLGHVVTGGAVNSDFGGSLIEARISAHQSGTTVWRVTCDGAL